MKGGLENYREHKNNLASKLPLLISAGCALLWIIANVMLRSSGYKFTNEISMYGTVASSVAVLVGLNIFIRSRESANLGDMNKDSIIMLISTVLLVGISGISAYRYASYPQSVETDSMGNLSWVEEHKGVGGTTRRTYDYVNEYLMPAQYKGYSENTTPVDTIDSGTTGILSDSEYLAQLDEQANSDSLREKDAATKTEAIEAQSGTEPAPVQTDVPEPSPEDPALNVGNLDNGGTVGGW